MYHIATDGIAQTITDGVRIAPELGEAGESGFDASFRWYANTERIRQIDISR